MWLPEPTSHKRTRSMMQLSRSFGIALRQLREQRHWSQEGLAQHADLNRSYVGELERGQACPSLLTLEKLALALNLSLTNLLAHTEQVAKTQLAHNIKCRL